MKLRALAAAGIAMTLGLGGALVVAAPANAAYVDVLSSTVHWEGVDDASGVIDDGYMETYSAAGSIEGFNYDAFDGFGYLDLTDGVSTYNFSAVSSTSNIVDGGTSTLTLIGDTGATFAVPLQVTLTLTFEGNFVRWDYKVVDTALVPNTALVSALVWNFYGNLGSDSRSAYAVNGNTLISNDTTSASDPILAYSAGADNGIAYDVTDGDDDVTITAANTASFVLTMALAGYDASGRDAAIAALTALAPNLADADVFGTELPTYSSVVFDAISLTAGTPVDQVATYTIDQDTADEYYSFTDFDLNNVEAVFGELPAGVTATFAVNPDGSFLVTLGGTPTVSGSFSPSITIYKNSGGDRYDPLGSVLPITIAAAPVVPPVVDPPVVVPPVVEPPVVTDPEVELVELPQGYVTAPASITVSQIRSTGFTASSIGFVPGETVTVGLGTGATGGEIGTAVADANGRVTYTLIDTDSAFTPEGTYTLVFVGAASLVRIDVNVVADPAVAAPAALASTGADITVTLYAAVALLLAGLGAVVLRRRTSKA